jgi:MFS family permease
MNPYVFGTLLAVGIALVPFFIMYEKKAKHPMLNLGLFKNRNFSACITASFLNYTAQFIMVFLAPFYLEDIRMFPPAMTGLLYMPMPIAILIVAPISGALSDKINTRILSSAGMGMMAAGLIMLSFMGADTPNWYIVISMIACGIGSGMFQTPNNTALMSSAPSDCRGIASGSLSIARNLGMVIGVALSGLMFTAISGEGIPNGAVSAAQQGIFVNALHITFIAAGAVALLAMLASLTKGNTKPVCETAVQETE